LSITSGPDSNLWFTENTASKIGRITTASVIAEFATPTSNSGPQGIVAGLDGSLWFTEELVDKVGKSTTAGSIAEIPLFFGSDPKGIAAGTNGSIYVSEQNPSKFLRIILLGGQLSFSETILAPGRGVSGITFLEDKNSSFGLMVGTGTQSNTIIIDKQPIASLVDFTKTAIPDPVVAGSPLTYVFTVKNNSLDPIRFRIADIYPRSVRFFNQPGWKDLSKPLIDYRAIESDTEITLMPGDQTQIPLDFDTLGPGVVSNSASLTLFGNTRIATTVTSTINPATGPDFSIGFGESTVRAPIGTKARIVVNINRTGGFAGPVTLTPPTDLPPGVVAFTDTTTTIGSSETFVFKVKRKANPGQYPLTFTATDASGKTRTATATLIVP
jgi:hypothetical protein